MSVVLPKPLLSFTGSRRTALPPAGVDAMDALYATLPGLACKRLCQECCGPVFMEKLEWERIGERLGRYPRPTPEQAAKLECPMLADGGCTVYDLRPAVCRLWGLVESMRCPHGCVPERVLTDAEGHEFLGRVAEINDTLGVR